MDLNQLANGQFAQANDEPAPQEAPQPIVFAAEPADPAEYLPTVENPVVFNSGPYQFDPERSPQPRGSTGYSRTVPWGVAKYVASSEALQRAANARQAMIAAGLDWEVDLHDVYLANQTQVKDHYAVVRLDTMSPLGIVGKRYVPVQNRRLAEYTDTLVTASGGSGVGMGEIKGGRKVFTVVQLNDIRPAGMPDETLGSFLVNSNSHDGSSVLYSTVVNVRWACLNGLIALVEMPHTVKVRHTGNVEMRMKEAQRILAGASAYLTEQVDLMEELLGINIQVRGTQALELVDELIPIPDEGPARQTQQARQDALMALWLNSDNLNDVRGTGWGFVNAVAEWDQWDPAAVRRRRLDPMERLLGSGSTVGELTRRARDLVLS